MKRTILQTLFASLLLCFILISSGCSSGSNSGGEGPTITGTGKFIDGPVSGLHYQSTSHEGITNTEGEFDYTSGEVTTFSYGDITLGTSKGAAIVTPRNLVNGSENIDTVLNILRFLQTLDINNDHDDGIQLPDFSSIITAINSINFNQSELDFESDSNLQQFLNDSINSTTLIDADEAASNFEEALVEAGVHTLEGRTLYRYENGNGSDFGLREALWCDTWHFSGGKIYKNVRTIDNLSSCSNVSSTPFASYTVNEGNLVWTADFEENGTSETIEMVLLNDSAPFLYRFGELTGDRERNRLYETKTEVETLLASSVFEANGDRFELILTETSPDFFLLQAVFTDRNCTVIEGKYAPPEFTSDKGERFDANTSFVQEGSGCFVKTSFSNPIANTKYYAVARGLDGIGLENLKTSITHQP